MSLKISRINAGFISIFAVLVILLSFWGVNLQKNSRLLEDVVSESKEATLINKMVHAMHNRTIALYRMLATEDPFEADDQLLAFMHLAEEFMKTRGLVLSGSFSEEEKQLWDETMPLVNQSQQATNEVLKLVTDGQITKARIVLDSKVKPIQELVMQQLNRLVQVQRREIDEDFRRFQDSSRTTYIFIAFLFVIIFSIAVLIMVTLRNKHNAEAGLIQQGERIRALYDISAISGMSFDQQIEETLNFGRVLLDTEMAKVSLIDAEQGINTVTHIVAPDEILQAIPKVQPLAETLCNITFNSEKPLILHHAALSEYKDNPSYLSTGIETYVAVPIWVNDKKYGTVCFANRRPRLEPFSETDLDLIGLIAKWISVNIERQKSQQIELEKKQAIAASKTKSDFLANMSHEIRTPLNAIIGFAEASLYTKPSRQELETSLQTIVHSSHHLLQLINNILDLSKVESGNMAVESLCCSLFTILADVEMLLQPEIEKKGLQFILEYQFPLPAKINTDPVKLKQILLNLCSNAIKFTETGQIKIEASYSEGPQRLKIAVIDSGVGLDEEQQVRIFEPFTQADISTTRKYGGTGLGLSLSRQLISLLGGDLTLRSKPEEGSRFEFEITVGGSTDTEFIRSKADIPKRQESIQDHVEKIALNGQVLIVDDIVENQKLLKLLLVQIGLDVSIASNGQEALGRVNAKQQAYDLILMDMQMPIMDGYTAVETLRKQGYQAPIVALTADAMSSHREKCLAIGCDEFLSKPINRDELAAVLIKFLKPGNEASLEAAIESKLIVEGPEFESVVKEFVEELPARLEMITNFFKTSNWQEMAFQLHALKGVIANLGYPVVAELLQDMESSLKEGHYDRLEETMPELEDMFKRMARVL